MKIILDRTTAIKEAKANKNFIYELNEDLSYFFIDKHVLQKFSDYAGGESDLWTREEGLRELEYIEQLGEQDG